MEHRGRTNFHGTPEALNFILSDWTHKLLLLRDLFLVSVPISNGNGFEKQK